MISLHSVLYINLCAIDVSKAFDMINNFALLNKLIKRLLPVKLLSLLENWLLNCHSCVKWDSYFSQFLNWSMELGKP